MNKFTILKFDSFQILGYNIHNEREKSISKYYTKGGRHYYGRL